MLSCLSTESPRARNGLNNPFNELRPINLDANVPAYEHGWGELPCLIMSRVPSAERRKRRHALTQRTKQYIYALTNTPPTQDLHPFSGENQMNDTCLPNPCHSEWGADSFGDEGSFCGINYDFPMTEESRNVTRAEGKENDQHASNQPLLSLNITPIHSDFEVLDTDLSTARIVRHLSSGLVGMAPQMRREREFRMKVERALDVGIVPYYGACRDDFLGPVVLFHEDVCDFYEWFDAHSHGVAGVQDVTFVVVACHLAWDAANLNGNMRRFGFMDVKMDNVLVCSGPFGFVTGAAFCDTEAASAGHFNWQSLDYKLLLACYLCRIRHDGRTDEESVRDRALDLAIECKEKECAALHALTQFVYACGHPDFSTAQCEEARTSMAMAENDRMMAVKSFATQLMLMYSPETSWCMDDELFRSDVLVHSTVSTLKFRMTDGCADHFNGKTCMRAIAKMMLFQALPMMSRIDISNVAQDGVIHMLMDSLRDGLEPDRVARHFARMLSAVGAPTTPVFPEGMDANELRRALEW